MKAILALSICMMFAAQSTAIDRTWRDKTGQYEIQAKLLVFNGEIAVLKRSDGELVAFPVAELSDADREFLQSEDAESVYKNEKLQTWTFHTGKQIQAYLVSHIDKDVVLQTRRGRLYVNDRPVGNLPDVYQLILPMVIGHFENTEFADLQELRRWVTRRAGSRPIKYHSEGVVLAMENGDEYAFPYFLFSDEDRKFLEGGKDEFRHPENSEEDRLNQALYMQAMARDFQRDRQFDRQVQLIQTQMLAVASGIVDLWEVAMVPRGGNIFQARSVIVPARNSAQASQLAAQKWPGLMVGSIRRVTRN